jgi:uncharacterized protein (TIGR02453 family)
MAKTKTFPGFSPKALTFFRQLEKSNTREWFAPRKEQFEQLLRQPMLELVAKVNEALRSFAVDHVTDPPKALFRIYRDTRFSKDKSPYKTQLAAHFPRAGMARLTGSSFYFSVSHKHVEIAGGMYMPAPPQLAAVRAAIAQDSKPLLELCTAKALCKALGPLKGAKLARVPKGFAADHPAADLLRQKQWYFYATFPASLATRPTFAKEIVRHFRLLWPFVQYLNEAVIQQLREEEAASQPIPKRPAPMF